jgi:hypothetical protein
MKQVDELIRGEMSAVKSIDAILNKINDETEKRQLYAIRQDHVQAIDKLKRFAGAAFQDSGATSTAGPWGAFASAFKGGASFFGDKAALLALKVGEQHGLNEYREAIRDDAMDSQLRQVIQNDLLPAQEQHLRTIDRYLQ